MYPGTAVINVPSDNIKNYLMSLPTTQGFDRKLANRLDEVAGFNFEATTELNSQFSTRPINTPVTANQVADYYQNEGKKAGYKLTQFNLANDSKLNALWLLQEKPGASFGILIVEVKEVSEANRIFGGKFNPGDCLIFLTPLA